MYKTMTIHEFNKSRGEGYSFPTYVRDDDKYTIQSRPKGPSSRRIYVVIDANDNEVGIFDNLKDAKFFFEVDRNG